MIFYVTVGGMKGTTWVQIVKAVLLMAGTVLITVLVLAKFDFNLSDLLGAAAEKTGKGEAFLAARPAVRQRPRPRKIDFLSLGLALVLGTAGLPHILIRFYTVPTAQDARKSVLWAIGLIGTFYLMTLVLGFGAAALLDTGTESEVADLGAATWPRRCWPRRSAAVPGHRRRGPAGADRGGRVRDHPRGGRRADAHLGVVGRARPLRQRVQEGQGHREGARSGSPGSRRSSSAASRSLLAIPAQKLNIAFLVALAFAVAASANLPAMLYNLFWRRFNTRGAVWSIYGGLISCVGAGVLLAGRVRQSPDGDRRCSRRHRLRLVPARATRASSRSRSASSSAGSARSRRKEPEAEDAYTELEVRALTGAGAEKAVVH